MTSTSSSPSSELRSEPHGEEPVLPRRADARSQVWVARLGEGKFASPLSSHPKCVPALRRPLEPVLRTQMHCGGRNFAVASRCWSQSKCDVICSGKKSGNKRRIPSSSGRCSHAPSSLMLAGSSCHVFPRRAPYKSSPGLILFDKLTAHTFLSFLFVVLAPCLASPLLPAEPCTRHS